MDLPDDFVKRLKSVSAKRAKTVIDHILEHGHITTEELKDTYGYDHPPRAARDVREQGIPLETFKVKGAHGRSIGAYRFGDPSKIKGGKLGGRMAWPKSLKDDLVAAYGERCGICLTKYEARYLQIDHRIPYEVAGDSPGEAVDLTKYMLICGSCNRAKSWSCEHCKNWTDDHNPTVCATCYWTSPESYAHVALRAIRRLDLTWTGDEVPDHERLIAMAKYAKKRLPDFVKEALRGKTF